MFNYEEFLLKQLTIIKNEQEFNDLDIEISTEEAFAKKKNFKPNTMYVIIKFLESDITFGAVSKPLNIVSICEQNNLERCKAILDIFASLWNFKSESITNENGNNDIYKHSYGTAVVISNFEEVGYGYRTVLYLSGNLTVLENVIDITNLNLWLKQPDDTYKAEPINSLRTDIAYNMTPNTQQKASEPIASSMKSVAVLTLTMVVPFTENTLTQRVMQTLDSKNNGNIDYIFSFKWGTHDFEKTPFKLTSVGLTSIVGEIPAFTLSFTR